MKANKFIEEQIAICTGKEDTVPEDESFDYESKFKYADEEQLSFRNKLSKLEDAQKKRKEDREAKKFITMEERKRVCDELEQCRRNSDTLLKMRTEKGRSEVGADLLFGRRRR